MTEKIAIFAADSDAAQATQKRLQESFTPVDVSEADCALAIGGDGMMLRALHQVMDLGIPVYGINRGSYGFLMNPFDDAQDLPAKISAAETITLYPLMMESIDDAGAVSYNYAINDISLFRRTAQIAKLKIAIDGKTRMESLWCDGVIVATAAGSTAYNYAAYGSIVPLDSRILSLTPVAPFRPPRWRGALLHHESVVTIAVHESDKRPVSAAADNFEIVNVCEVKIFEDTEKPLHLLFDPDAHLAERILKQQFAS